MSDRLTDEDLDAIEARANAATEGPWNAEYSAEQGNCVLPPGAESTREAVAVFRLLRQQADAEFVAHARTDVPVGSFEAAEKFSESLPVALNALEAVLALHGPGEVYISTDDCADPDGHEWHTDVGGYGVCLSEPTGDLYCKGCMYDEYADPADFPWPCPITRAINEALGVSA